jgi:hypothetical protein
MVRFVVAVGGALTFFQSAMTISAISGTDAAIHNDDGLSFLQQRTSPLHQTRNIHQKLTRLASQLRVAVQTNEQEEETNRRQRAMQSDALYLVKYAGEFQVLRDSVCQSPSPTIRLYCGGDIALGKILASSINCTALTDLPSSNYSGLECTNSCTGTACEKVYLNQGSVEDGPFGRVEFTCSGNLPENVFGAIAMVDSGDGSCLSNLGSTHSLNFQVARLGVLCGSDYVFDEYYAECGLPSGLYGHQDNFSDAYSCFDGKNCAGVACTVNFTSFLVTASVVNFLDTCVVSSIPIPAPEPLPNLPPSSVVVTAQFEANWGQLSSSSACSSGDLPKVRIRCLQGGTITLIDKPTTTIDCQKNGTDTLVCETTESAAGFDSLTYVRVVVH